jgi:hypothetical protein
VLVMTAAAPPATAADTEARLKQAAQHFVDLEDAQAKAILDGLSAEGVADADVLLGYLLADPLYAGRDYTAAVTAFRRAADAGNEEAVFQLAEARFWPAYSDWKLMEAEEATRPSAAEAFDLLQRTVRDRPSGLSGAGARYWRLAWLCTFGGYDCGKEVTDAAVRKGGQQVGNLSLIKGGFQIIDSVRSGEIKDPEHPELLQALLALGMAAADPFVAVLATGSTWRDLDHGGTCPEPISLAAAGRLLALEGGTVADADGWRDFKRCFAAGQEALVREDLATSLDKIIRAHSNENTWHLYTCYQVPEASSFGDCLIHAVPDHYFACTKLSLIDYLRARYKIDYTETARYVRCRETMISAREG